MGNELNIILIICGAFTMASTIASLWTDCWQINSKGSVMLSTRCKGLWRECVWDRFVKIWTCDVFSSYLNPHPATIILTRALIITSSITSVLAFLLLVFGFKNFNYCQDTFTKLLCLRLSSGLHFLVGEPFSLQSRDQYLKLLTFLSGMSSCAGIIRYCVYVYYIHQYEVSLKIPGFPSFEYGYSLWMAVGGSLGAISTAIITCYVSRHYKKPHDIKIKDVSESRYSDGQQVVKTYV